MKAADLPTPAQIIARAGEQIRAADKALSDARDWLQSDWRPDTEPTDEQVAARRHMRQAIRLAKMVITAQARGDAGLLDAIDTAVSSLTEDP